MIRDMVKIKAKNLSLKKFLFSENPQDRFIILISLNTAVDAVKRPAINEIVKNELEDAFCNSLRKVVTVFCISAGKTSSIEKIYFRLSIPEKLIALIRDIKKGNTDRTKK